MNDLIKVQTLNTPTGKYLGFDGVHLQYTYLRIDQAPNYFMKPRKKNGEYHISDADAFCIKYCSNCCCVLMVLATIAMIRGAFSGDSLDQLIVITTGVRRKVELPALYSLRQDRFRP